MTKDAYLDCLRLLRDEMIAAERSGDQDSIAGTVRAAHDFLSLVKAPVGKMSPRRQEKRGE